MLVLTRKLNEIIRIGADISVVVVLIDRNKVRLGVKAPRNVPVFRSELVDEPPAEEGEGRRDG